MRDLAQKNHRMGGRMLGLVGLLAMLLRPVRRIGSATAHRPGVAYTTGQNRTAHKAERQRIRYARMHNRKGCHV